MKSSLKIQCKAETGTLPCAPRSLDFLNQQELSFVAFCLYVQERSKRGKVDYYTQMSIKFNI